MPSGNGSIIVFLLPTFPEPSPAFNAGVVPRSKLFSDLFKTVRDDRQPAANVSFKGCPSISFSKEDVEELSHRFRFALIGRFRRRPPITVVKNFLTRLGLAGGFTVGELNQNSILINFEKDEDYQRFFFRKSWTLARVCIELDVSKTLHQRIHIKHVEEDLFFQDKHNNSFSIISTVYGSHSAKERTALWDNIASFNNLNPHPWCLGGDFNCISDSLHHKGARLPDLGAISDFSNCITNCNLQECSFTGPHFTWHGSRSNGNVWRRLDRVFYNAEWGEHWESISMHHLAKGGSDHCPILFSSKQGCGQGPKSFRFQNMWLLRKDFLQVCKDTWEEMPYFGGMRCLFSKLQHLKGKLSSWNKEHFEEGGIGTRNLESLEEAYSLKLWWKFHMDDGIWARLMRAKYWRDGKLIEDICTHTKLWLLAKCPKNFRVADEWLENKGLLPRFLNHPKPRMVKWLAPPKGRLKINIDASFNMTSSRGAAIIRNEEGSFVRAASFQVSAQTPYQAELAASIKDLEIIGRNLTDEREWKQH
ncbi:unnamed protein product [Cuscuta campestris]|uniref:Endonuclease/exonuclease/phosphatase domain-containing protein n=1 Tax=Cuscuta campestris TaxID=132261 RepID=A0A484LRW6_9ASTE|nr:unnamed protein product [Cuscuta campestris]